MIKYISVAKEESAEQIIEKSRFIAHVKKVDSREAADEFLAEIRKQYKDATHNVPAFVIGEKQELVWASDDGEPSGTSGAPIAQMIVKEGLTNVALVVTRYFGGIKLGTGGLVRAYTSTARLALEKAGRLEVREYKNIKCCIPYSMLATMQKKSEDLGYEITQTEYSDNIVLCLKFEAEKEEDIINNLSDIFNGNFQIIY